MRRYGRCFRFFAWSFILIMATAADAAESDHLGSHPRWALVVHGGAGVMKRADMPPEKEAAVRAALAAALAVGAKILNRGGSGLDAVEAVIRGLEDDPLFNAGRGAVFTADGRNELDAAIMDGASLKAGAVAGVTRIRNPISLARAVMDQSPHVLLIGPGAESFGADHGFAFTPPSWFFTEARWQQLKKVLRSQGKPIPPRPPGAPPEPADHGSLWAEDHKFGTVGVAALDTQGHLAAGTSTGGVTAKLWGRVGDSPIIGAGTYASDRSCAVSATGTGEYFIRLTVAREVCALVEYRHMPLQQAADEMIQKRVKDLGGDGGLIAVAPDGEIAWSFNTDGMYRAKQVQGGKPVVAIFAGEP